MKINTSLALFAKDQLQTSSKAIARSLQRLSTGLRVNSAKDDAASLAIGNKLEAQSRGLYQAIHNINHAQGMLSTAEGAIETQIELVIRMRELAVQASNGTLSTVDRQNLNQEITSLYNEFSRISADTEFNGTKLLDGSFGSKQIQVGGSFEQGMNPVYVGINDLSASKQFVKTIGFGTFQAAVTYSNGTRADNMKLVDLNGDGILDLVTSDINDATVSTSLGNANGTFQGRRTYTTGTSPGDIATGDVNGDGITDVVVAESGTSAVAIFLGNGDGTLRTRTTKSVGGAATGVALGDFNKDGKLDIVTANASAASASLLLGVGDGTFQTATSITTESNANRVATGDFNNDGNLDFVTTDNSGTISILKGVGDGTFSSRLTKSTGTTPMGLAVGDLNADGASDIIVANSGASTISVFLNTNAGSGAMNNATAVTVNGNPYSIALGDVNGDGILDVVTSNGSTAAGSIVTGKGDGTFNSYASFASVVGRDLELGDLNGDGVLDIVTQDRTNNYYAVHLGYTTTATAVGNIDVTTQSKAQSLIKILDSTLASLKKEQANLQGIHSRLDQAAAANLLLKDNFDTARSDMIDADFAMETAELVKNQILQQTQTAVLAQANVQNQIVMQLLRFQ